MEKKYSETFSRLVYYDAESLGATILDLGFREFDTPNTSSVKWSKKCAELCGVRPEDGRVNIPLVHNKGCVVPVYDLLPKKIVTLSLLSQEESYPTATSYTLTRCDAQGFVLTTVFVGAGKGPTLTITLRDSLEEVFVVDPGFAKTKEDLQGLASRQLREFLYVCTLFLGGGKLIEAKPTLSRTATAMKRTPVYKLSYTTVQLPGVKLEQKPHQGGTHASPRQHERRGHWRTYRSGKRVWVKNCVVGDPSLGHVKHAYVVTQGASHG